MKKVVYIIVIIAFSSCQNDDENRQAYIDHQVQQKLNRHILSKEELCLSKLLKKVSMDVDSVMLGEAALDKKKDVSLPDKKTRPVRPTNKLPDFEKPANPIKEKN